ncbi:MAG: hypothetical protein ACXABY_00540 [Candidatus Thorarchaeota archaeon]|jgi:hypothetical protein
MNTENLKLVAELSKGFSDKIDVEEIVWESQYKSYGCGDEDYIGESCRFCETSQKKGHAIDCVYALWEQALLDLEEESPSHEESSDLTALKLRRALSDIEEMKVKVTVKDKRIKDLEADKKELQRREGYVQDALRTLARFQAEQL